MLPIIDLGIGTVCPWRVVEGEAGGVGGAPFLIGWLEFSSRLAYFTT